MEPTSSTAGPATDSGPSPSTQKVESPSHEGGSRPEGARSDSKNLSKGSSGRERGGRQGKNRDLGRSAWAKTKTDKRKRNNDEQDAKRRRVDRGEAPLPIYATKFSEDVLASEERRPKKKVAVLIGYSGTGYKGMQLAHDQKTIEGDLFQAFVAAGAISKANADDPKKSSFVRCARTDKGVHAAGNIISLKLIVEDEDIVKKINDHLTSQIRVWGFERTNNSFSAYQLCDSRIYEYLIPTNSFLPPHPSSYLGRKIEELAAEHNNLDGLRSRQQEVEDYWQKIDEEHIRPILGSYDEYTRSILEKALYLKPDEKPPEVRASVSDDNPLKDQAATSETTEPIEEQLQNEFFITGEKGQLSSTEPKEESNQRFSNVAEGMKQLRSAYTAAKRQYRIPASRLRRVEQALALYEGTRNYHNYTIEKAYKDPSAKRVIKSFIVNPTPIIIDGTEWLSLKVHGQSFMMHQIRKMVAMVALVVRCGCDPKRIIESYGPEKISIPKAPSLGLLLERPVFDSYNKRAKSDLGKEQINFDKFKKEMDEFKQREIYDRMYQDEQKDNLFGNFFNHVDNFPVETFLFVTSGGIKATKAPPGASRKGGDNDKAVLTSLEEDSDGEMAPNDANGDEG